MNEIIIISVETNFYFLMASVTTVQQHNKVAVLGRVFGVVREESYLKTPHKDIGRCDYISQAVHCVLLSLHHMCNLTHTE